ncbi:hypothetical protein HYS93_02635 [Candidatus Daviesbacteria bacterium]|nr:hypothetical protein [Candidatus Daviesbacteria bacterium]
MESALSRRRFLEFALLSTAGIVAATPDNLLPKPPEFDPGQLGVNIHLGALKWFGLDDASFKKAVDILFSLPFKRVRIPIPLNEVGIKKGSWNFSTTDPLIERAVKEDKLIDFQQGIKTIGYPEVKPPRWLIEENPYLLDRGVDITKEEVVREYIYQYHRAVGERYFGVSNIVTIQAGNEALSRGLEVTNLRYETWKFNETEIDLVRSLDPYRRPIVQNVPWDNLLPKAFSRESLDALISVISSNKIDILGLTIYNNTQAADLLWTLVNIVFVASRIVGKPVKILEYQSAPWLNANKEPNFPFYEKRFHDGLERIKAKRPLSLHFWDVEQIIWRSLRGEREYQRRLNELMNYFDNDALAA